MKYKIFYRPQTFDLIGFSDGEVSLNFPYLEVELDMLHSLDGYAIVDSEIGPVLVLKPE